MPYRTPEEIARDEAIEHIEARRDRDPNARWQVIVYRRDGAGDWCRESHPRDRSYAQVVEASDHDVAAAARRHGVALTYRVELW